HAPTALPPSAAKASSFIGPYKLLQQIGEGGMGSVWMAEQEYPVKRRVALKLIRADMGSKETIARFEAERQALAMMDHPNIARVLDAGTTDGGSPYFVMELVKGVPLTDYCDQNKLSIRERLELFVPVCAAVQHAHQKGIIHRDLKPSNVLVTLYDGKPTPKVIDFGLAKALEHTTTLTDKTMFTEFGKVVGTLQYMSPEQAEINALDVDTRTDIYSLGVMLYELLTGSTPLEKETLGKQALLQVLAIIRETVPPRPSNRLSSSGEAASGISEHRKIASAKLQQILRGELDWVVMRALEKDRSRRYESANNFADDIQRYLNDDTVKARPPTARYRVSKFVRKNRTLVVTAATIAGLLIAGIAGTSWFAFKANQSAVAEKAQKEIAEKKTAEVVVEKNRANERKLEAEIARSEMKKSLYLSQINLAANALDQGDIGQLTRQLERARNYGTDGFELQYLSRVPRSFLANYTEHDCSVKAVAISPDGDLVATGDTAGELRVWKISDGKTVFLADANERKPSLNVQPELTSITFSPNGKTLAVAGYLGKLALWDIQSQKEIHVFKGHSSQVFDVGFSPDGRHIASASADMTVRIWDVQTSKQIGVLSGHRNMVYSVSYSPDGKQIASAGQDGTVKVWNSATRDLDRTFSDVKAFINEIAFSPDGTLIGAVYEIPFDSEQQNADVVVWNVVTGERVLSMRPQPGSIHAIDFSADSRFLVTGADDGTIRVTNIFTGKPETIHAGHLGRIWDLTISKDGLLLASCGKDGTAKIRSTFTDAGYTTLDSQFRPRSARIAFSSLETIAIGSERGVEIRSVNDGPQVIQLQDKEHDGGHWLSQSCLAVSHDDRLIAGYSLDQKVISVWEASTNNVVNRFQHDTYVTDVCFSSNSAHLATSCEDGTVRVYELDSGNTVSTFTESENPIQAIAFDNDSKLIAIAPSNRASFWLWDWRNGEPASEVSNIPHPIQDVIFSPDGTQVVTGGVNGPIHFWEVKTSELVFSLAGHSGGTYTIDFMPGGMRLVSGGADRLVKIWDLETKEQFLQLNGHHGSVDSIAVSTDGTKIASVNASGPGFGELLLWETEATLSSYRRRMNMTYQPDWYRKQLLHSVAEGNLFAAKWHSAALERAEPNGSRNAIECADAMLQLKHLDEAEHWSNLAIEREPDSLRARKFRGDLFVRLDRLEDAIADFVHCANLNPKDSQIRYRIATIQEKIGDFEAAFESYSAAVQINPDFAEALCDKGQLLIRMGRFDEAVTALESGHETGIKRTQPKAGPSIGYAPWRFPSKQWIDEAKQLTRLNAELATFISGERIPEGVEENYYVTRIFFIHQQDDKLAKMVAEMEKQYSPKHPLVLKSRVLLASSFLRSAENQEDKQKKRELRDNAYDLLQDLLFLGRESGNPKMLKFVAAQISHSVQCQNLRRNVSVQPKDQDHWITFWAAIGSVR
ncbi:MAG: protein kinase, partial [Pirellulaceae bacterium]|nr:protein kinase [Pirellulaceae bacterium]